MCKQVILTLMQGSFEKGFPVLLRIKEDNVSTGPEIRGILPPTADILEAFNNWHLAYNQLVASNSRIVPKPAQVTNFSYQELGSKLENSLNDWLNSGNREWQKIRDELQRNLRIDEEIQVIIQTDDIQLQRIPWHLWDLFSNHYTKAEIALSAPECKPKSKKVQFNNKVRILAILGDNTGINLDKDRAILEQLPNAKVTFLIEPQREELTKQLWDKQWEIMFFAGHSSSQLDSNTGRFYINKTDSLSITDLKYALRNAIEKGLQLAIFNSCDGLGLARELADLQIPQVIVMRELVPDLIAQEFLKCFLTSFAQGKNFYLAVREARERLQSLENKFPFASWLPVICQNPAVSPLSWHGLVRKNTSCQRIIQLLSKKKLLLLIPLILTLEPIRENAWKWLQSLLNPISANGWKAEYFSNTETAGIPVYTEYLDKIDKWWDDSAPPDAPQDNFSALFTKEQDLAPGRYLIKVSSDDGVQVWLDNKPIIDKWGDLYFDRLHPYCNIFQSDGTKYSFKVKYQEKQDKAGINLDIQPFKSFDESVKDSGCKFAEPVKEFEWRATFFQYPQINLSKPPRDFYDQEANVIGSVNLGSKQRSDGKPGIIQSWGAGSPQLDYGIPNDFFVVRAYTQVYFESGKKYRVWVKADDGFQLFAKHHSLPDNDLNKLIYITPKDQWLSAYGRYERFDFTVPNTGLYDFHFHYYEERGDAYIDLYWEDITPPQSNSQSVTSSTKLNNRIRSVNFTGKVVLNVGINLCLEPNLNSCTSEQESYNKTLSFEGWTYGETVKDIWTGNPDALWFKLSDQNRWVPSAFINGYPPENTPLQPNYAKQ